MTNITKKRISKLSLFAAILIVMSTAPGCVENTANSANADPSIVGIWELTSETSRGTRTATLVINKDLTGTYARREREFPVNDLTIKGEQVSFKVTMKYREREFESSFAGKLLADSLNGQWTTSRGTREVIGKRIDPK